jgi:hypothetical protein
VDRRRQVLKRLDKAWVAFNESYAGLSDAQVIEPGVTGAWSVRDTLAHVTAWEEEALKHLPLILKGGMPPRYSVQYGGIDAFNARMTEQKRNLSLSEVRTQLAATHGRLVDFIQSARPRASTHRRNPLPPSTTARYVQPLPAPRRGDSAMATADFSQRIPSHVFARRRVYRVNDRR